jgi:hypothetical protein
VLDHYNAAGVNGQRYRVQRDEQELVLTRRESGERLMQATWDDDNETWQPMEPLNLTAGDRAQLKSFAQQFYQQQQAAQEQRRQERAEQRQLAREPELEL